MLELECKKESYTDGNSFSRKFRDVVNCKRSTACPKCYVDPRVLDLEEIEAVAKSYDLQAVSFE